MTLDDLGNPGVWILLILTFSVVTVGILPLRQRPGDFAASCHDKRSH